MRELSRFKRVVICIVLAVLLVLSFSYLNGLAALDAYLDGDAVGELAATVVGGQFWVLAEEAPPSSLLLLLFVPPLFYGFLRLPKRNEIVAIVVSFFISAFIILGYVCAGDCSIAILFRTPVCALLTLVALGSFLILIYALLSVGFMKVGPLVEGARSARLGRLGLDGHKAEEGAASGRSRFFVASKVRYLLLPGVVLVIGWVLVLIPFFPGCVSADLSLELLQYKGAVELTTHHPVAATLIYGSIFSAGELLGGPNGGVILMVAFQIIVMAAALGFQIYVLSNLGAPRWVLILTTMFFALSPAVSNLVMLAIKDTLFAALFSVYVSLLLILVLRPAHFSVSRGFTVAFLIFAIGSGLLRPNAVFAFVLSLPFLVLVFKDRKGRLWAAAMAIAIIVLIPGLTFGVNVATKAASGSIAEALSVPIQQIARTVVNDERSLSDEDREAIAEALDYEGIEEGYDPLISDPIKNAFDAEASVPHFLKTWLSIGLRHPIIYADAWAYMTYGYLTVQPYPTYENTIIFFTQGYAPYLGFSFEASDATRRVAGVAITAIQGFPGIGITTQPGLYTWLLLIECAYLAYAGRSRKIVGLLPLLFLILTVLFGPMNGSVRYFFPIIATAPICLWFALCAPLIPGGRRTAKKGDEAQGAAPLTATDDPFVDEGSNVRNVPGMEGVLEGGADVQGS